MAKRNRFGGWDSYRYGKGAAVSSRPIYNPAQRDRLAISAAELMADFKFSKWEHEGPVRHGLRSRLCERGHGWQQSDDEAAEVVRSALSIIGAGNRPTWAEGQPEHTAASDTCLQCMGPLDDDATSRSAKFCCGDCAKAYVEKKGNSRLQQQQAIHGAARRLIKAEQRPTKCCDQCGKHFKPLTHLDAAAESARYCSRTCASLAHRSIPERECTRCGTMYRHRGKFCSHICARTKQAPAHEVLCTWCGEPYLAKTPVPGLCSNPCAIQSSKTRRGLVPAKELNRSAFDHFITMPINASRPAWLTPERFDDLVAA